jgi:hypothetical protein
LHVKRGMIIERAADNFEILIQEEMNIWRAYSE